MLQCRYIVFKDSLSALTLPRLSLLLVSWLLTACISEVSEPSTDVNQQSASPGTVLRSGEFSSSANCPQGGVSIEIGLDSNQNGELDDNEVQHEYEVCNGVDGSDGSDGENGTDGLNGLNSLIETSEELPGANCSYGGIRIDVGLDNDGSGILDSGEVDQTRYVCDGDDVQDSLVSVESVPPGLDCAAGGVAVSYGTDDSPQNGILESGEIEATEYVCNGESKSLVITQTEPAGANCPDGGVKIQSGLDTNGNDTLQPGEVNDTSYVCNSADTVGLSSLVELSAELPGGNCTYGGTRVDSGIDQNDNGSLDLTEVATTQYICEYQACQWIDNGDGTTTVNCPDGNTQVVLNPEALEFTEQISCVVSIRKPGTNEQFIPMLYTIDKINTQQKFISLTILDGQRQSTNSRLLTATQPAFQNSQIGLYFDNLDDANGGFYQARIREADNLVDFSYNDPDLDSNGYAASFIAFDAGPDDGICSQVFPVP